MNTPRRGSNPRTKCWLLSQLLARLSCFVFWKSAHSRSSLPTRWCPSLAASSMAAANAKRAFSESSAFPHTRSRLTPRFSSLRQRSEGGGVVRAGAVGAVAARPRRSHLSTASERDRDCVGWNMAQSRSSVPTSRFSREAARCDASRKMSEALSDQSLARRISPASMPR